MSGQKHPRPPALTIDCPIVDWAIEYPAAIPIFERLGIDYCCGGKSLSYACRQQGVEPEMVVEELMSRRHGGS